MGEKLPSSSEAPKIEIEGYDPREHRLVYAGSTIYVLNRDLTCVSVVDRTTLKPSAAKQHILGKKATIAEKVEHMVVDASGPPVVGALLHFSFPENTNLNLTSAFIANVVEPKPTQAE